MWKKFLIWFVSILVSILAVYCLVVGIMCLVNKVSFGTQFVDLFKLIFHIGKTTEAVKLVVL